MGTKDQLSFVGQAVGVTGIVVNKSGTPSAGGLIPVCRTGCWGHWNSGQEITDR